MLDNPCGATSPVYGASISAPYRPQAWYASLVLVLRGKRCTSARYSRSCTITTLVIKRGHDLYGRCAAFLSVIVRKQPQSRQSHSHVPCGRLNTEILHRFRDEALPPPQ